MSLNESSARTELASGATPTTWKGLRNSLFTFHKEEDGDAVQAILIIFVGVIILIALIKFFFPDVWEKLKEQITTLIEEKD
jgi:hypothetical protein